MAKGSYIGQVEIGDSTYPVGSILYGEATYNSSNGYWEVNNNNLTTSTFTDNNLAIGVTIHIKFNAINSVANSTLKIGGATAKPIVKYGTTAVGTTAKTSWNINAVVSFSYDGTSWVMNTGIDSDTTYSEISETNIKNTTSNSAGLISGRRFNAALTDRIDTSISNESTDTQVASAKAVYDYVDNKIGGLSGTMHFKGSLVSLPEATDSSTYSTYDAGDVVLVSYKEYVYDKGETANTSSWILLGDEGSYALKTNTVNVGSASNWSAGTPTTLGTAFTIPNVTNVGSAPTLGTAFSIPNVTDVGSAASFSVENGTLILNTGSVAQLGTAFIVPNVTNVGSAPTLGTAFTVPNVTSAGTSPSLTITSTTVVKPE